MKVTVTKSIVLSVVVILMIGGILIYYNFNRILADALMKSFNSTLVSQVYELKFKKLSVNIFQGDIKVSDVSLQPREKPLRHYPYINSSFKLKTKKLQLENVEIRSLLTSNKLILDKILIEKPEIEVSLTGKRSIMLPFKDTTSVSSDSARTKDGGETGMPLNSFFLKEFQLVDAAFHLTNEHKQRAFSTNNFSISLHALTVAQKPNEHKASFDKVALSFGEVSGKGLRKIAFKDFKIGIDSLDVHLSMDTMIYHFHDFTTRLSDLNILTIDSLFDITMGSFDLSYSKQSIKLKKIALKPNVSNDVLQSKHQYQHTEFTGTVGSLELKAINFDSAIYANKLFIDEVVLDSVEALIFKDKTKPFDKNKYPAYLGQTVKGISLPLLIKRVKATNVNLVNVERKPDSTNATVHIQRATAELKNITNLPTNEKLLMLADLYIENKAHAKLKIEFNYNKPNFNFDGTIAKFNLPDLNPLILAYTPAKINKGTLDEISFSGLAQQTKADGTLKFLYHDLEIDLELHEKAKWRNGLIAFAANTAVASSNPRSTEVPARVVQFHIERDMNKGFINVIMKSILNGLKETIIMSKENRKNYKEEKKEEKKEKKKKKKDDKL
jgi:hypothetical protein